MYDAEKQYPTEPTGLAPCESQLLGIFISESQRRSDLDPRSEDLAALAHQYGLVIVEDGAFDELGFVDTLPPIKQYDRDGHVVYLGTFSKTLEPGLRVGWAVGNDRVLTAMERLKKDLGHPIAEALVGRYLRCYDYDAHVRSLQQSYRIRRDAVVETLPKSVLPEGIPPYLKADIFYGFSCQKAGQANRLRMRGASGV